jgi:hypothetical protein
VRSLASEDPEEPESELASADTFASVDLLADHMVAPMLARLSTRSYGAGLEPVGETIEELSSGTSRSMVSRRFSSTIAERLADFCTRPLADRRWLIVFMDALGLAYESMTGAHGVTNADVVRGLIGPHRDRSLDAGE